MGLHRTLAQGPAQSRGTLLTIFALFTIDYWMIEKYFPFIRLFDLILCLRMPVKPGLLLSCSNTYFFFLFILTSDPVFSINCIFFKRFTNWTMRSLRIESGSYPSLCLGDQDNAQSIWELNADLLNKQTQLRYSNTVPTFLDTQFMPFNMEMWKGTSKNAEGVKLFLFKFLDILLNLEICPLSSSLLLQLLNFTEEFMLYGHIHFFIL